MKKLILSVLLLTISLMGVTAQELDPKALKQAKKELKANIKKAKTEANAAENPNFAEARAAINAALANPLAGDNAELYYIAGLVEYKCMEAERNKPATGGKASESVIYDCAYKSYGYYLKAWDLDQASEKPKYAEQIPADVTQILAVTSGFSANAIYHYNAKDWNNAYKFFDLFISAPNHEMLKNYPGAVNVVLALTADSAVSQMALNRALVATMIPDHERAIKDLQFMKGRNYELNSVYQLLCKEFLALGDSVSYENTLKEGIAAVPNEPFYATSLLNVYLNRQDYEAAAKNIDQLIAADPTNARFVDLKGRLLEQLGNEDAASECYKKAIELDPLSASSYANMGRILFNRALAKEDELYSKKKFDEAETVCAPLYDEAIPFLEKGFDLSLAAGQADSNCGIGLRQIYYKKLQRPSCPNKAELKEKYNYISEALGMEGMK